MKKVIRAQEFSDSHKYKINMEVLINEQTYNIKTHWSQWIFAEYIKFSEWFLSQPQEQRDNLHLWLKSERTEVTNHDFELMQQIVVRCSDIPNEVLQYLNNNDTVTILIKCSHFVRTLLEGLIYGHEILPLLALSNNGEVYKIKREKEFWGQFIPLPDMNVKQYFEAKALKELEASALSQTAAFAQLISGVVNGQLTQLPSIAAILVSDYNDMERIDRLSKEFEQQPMDILIDVFFYSITLPGSLKKLLGIYSATLVEVSKNLEIPVLQPEMN